MCLDKGYDYDEVRALLTEFGFTAHIRTRGEEAQALKQETGFKARRWVVERTHSWMNRFRRVLIRWDKKVRNDWGFCIWPVPISRIDKLAYWDRLLVAVLVIFMLLKYEDLRNRLIGLVGPGQLTVITRALEDVGQRVSRYLLMQFIINGSYGLAAGLGLFFSVCPMPCCGDFWRRYYAISRMLAPGSLPFSHHHQPGGVSGVGAACTGHWPVCAHGTGEQYGHGALALRPQYWGIGSGTAGRDRVLDLAVGTARARVGHTVDRLPVVLAGMCRICTSSICCSVMHRPSPPR